ncbi:hypothetical protein JXA32_02035 [Candidatus Sumerlaeota bacterium]|nr:hypothetical protein [Candidatus Sumerlaeota bacterium]
MQEQMEFTKLIARRLNELDVPYMLTGSCAMALYSMLRTTRDIDMVIELNRRKIPLFVRAFEQDCFIQLDSVQRAVDEQSIFNILHREWIIKADFIIRKNGAYFEQEFQRREVIQHDDVPVCTVSPEDLILAKLQWARDSESELQMRDVKSLLQDRTDLDRNHIEHWVERLELETLWRKVQGNE